mmetsp:Transcript_11913/g.43591  ORF Transcript_11913/g.43591 Transcript_11913/m.43591 type:complete len:223 (+) Transcript_11913:768-1436(+)
MHLHVLLHAPTQGHHQRVRPVLHLQVVCQLLQPSVVIVVVVGQQAHEAPQQRVAGGGFHVHGERRRQDGCNQLEAARLQRQRHAGVLPLRVNARGAASLHQVAATGEQRGAQRGELPSQVLRGRAAPLVFREQALHASQAAPQQLQLQMLAARAARRRSCREPRPLPRPRCCGADAAAVTVALLCGCRARCEGATKQPQGSCNGRPRRLQLGAGLAEQHLPD